MRPPDSAPFLVPLLLKTDHPLLTPQHYEDTRFPVYFEILQNTEENNGLLGHLNNPRRRKIKKHRGKGARIRNRLRERAQNPPLPSIMLTNVQSLDNKMDDPIICRSFYLPREISSIIVTAVYIPPQADTDLALSKLHDGLNSYINKHPDAAFIIVGDFNKSNLSRSCRTFIHMYTVQLEDRIHWIIATLSLKRPTMPAHYRLLANRTMPPYSSHRNINKGSFRNPLSGDGAEGLRSRVRKKEKLYFSPQNNGNNI